MKYIFLVSVLFYHCNFRSIFHIIYEQKKGHQFHQYQPNEQLPLILTELTKGKKRPLKMSLVIQVLSWDRDKHVAGLNRLMGLQPSRLDNWISNSNTYIIQQLKNLHRLTSTQKTTRQEGRICRLMTITHRTKIIITVFVSFWLLE